MMLCSYSFMPNLESTLNVINNTTILDQDEWNSRKIYHSISFEGGPLAVIFTFFSMVVLVYIWRFVCQVIVIAPVNVLDNQNPPMDLEMNMINRR